MSASSPTPASAASSAAWRAVEWPVSSARSRSSEVKVASWTSTSAPSAATRTMSHGDVSPENTNLRPRRVWPTTCSGATPLTVSPRCSRPKSGPGVTPSLAASSASKRPGRSSSISAYP